MRLFRLCKEAHSAQVLYGQGGLIDWGRWHSRGRRIVYCATAEALAVLEVRVNLGSEMPAASYVMHTLELADEDVIEIAAEALPVNWSAVPAVGDSQKLGDEWLSSDRTVALRVPSIHSRTDYNVLLNPLHPACERVRVLDRYGYSFDHRLFAISGPGAH